MDCFPFSKTMMAEMSIHSSMVLLKLYIQITKLWDIITSSVTIKWIWNVLELFSFQHWLWIICEFFFLKKKLLQFTLFNHILSQIFLFHCSLSVFENFCYLFGLIVDRKTSSLISMIIDCSDPHPFIILVDPIITI